MLDHHCSVEYTPWGWIQINYQCLRKRKIARILPRQIAMANSQVQVHFHWWIRSHKLGVDLAPFEFNFKFGIKSISYILWPKNKIRKKNESPRGTSWSIDLSETWRRKRLRVFQSRDHLILIKINIGECKCDTFYCYLIILNRFSHHDRMCIRYKHAQQQCQSMFQYILIRNG